MCLHNFSRETKSRPPTLRPFYLFKHSNHILGDDKVELMQSDKHHYENLR